MKCNFSTNRPCRASTVEPYAQANVSFREMIDGFHQAAYKRGTRSLSYLFSSSRELSRSPSPLRVPRGSPGQSRASLAGIAGRRWQRRDAGTSVHSRCRFWFRSQLDAGSRLDAGGRRYAGREAADLSGQICSVLVLSLLAVVLQRSEPDAVGRMAVGISVCNKAGFFCGSGAGDCGLQTAFSGLGDLEDAGLQLMCRLAQDLQRGSMEAAPGSEITAALCWLPSKMVEGRLLPPSSSASVFSCRRLQVNSNLQASMPLRRPLCFGAVGSRHLAPSGAVPGGVVLDCTAVCRSGGDGARLDGVFFISFRVLSAKSQGMVVISFSLTVLCVISPDRKSVV